MVPSAPVLTEPLGNPTADQLSIYVFHIKVDYFRMARDVSTIGKGIMLH
jgi:hypothetical protein